MAGTMGNVGALANMQGEAIKILADYLENIGS